MDINALVEDFANCVVTQTEAVLKSDASTGNEFVERYISAFAGLRSLGDAGRDALSSLLANERAEVLVMAAAYLLRYQHDRARAVLEKERKGKGLVAFSAMQALKRWDAGTWALDPL